MDEFTLLRVDYHGYQKMFGGLSLFMQVSKDKRSLEDPLDQKIGQSKN